MLVFSPEAAGRLVGSNSGRVLFEESWEMLLRGKEEKKIGKQALICIINFVVIHIFKRTAGEAPAAS